MTPEHFQLIISDLYEENYKSDFAKDLRENINDLTDFHWTHQFKVNRGVNVGGGNIGCGAGSVVGSGGIGVGSVVGGVGSGGIGVGSVGGGVGSGGIGVGSVGGVDGNHVGGNRP